MDINLTVNVFGRDTRIDWDFSAKSLIKLLDRLKKAVSQPQILCYSGYETITFKGYAKSDPFTSDFQVLEWVCKKLGWDGEDIRQFILDHSVEDCEWTEWRNRELTGIFYRKITLGQDMQNAIITEATEIQSYIRGQLEIAYVENAKKEKAENDEKARILAGVKWRTEAHDTIDEGGKTINYKHTIGIGGETFIIIERSVFDVGRVLNAQSGGMYSHSSSSNGWCIEKFDAESGWVQHEISDSHALAVEIVFRYGEYAMSGVRM